MSFQNLFSCPASGFFLPQGPIMSPTPVSQERVVQTMRTMRVGVEQIQQVSNNFFLRVPCYVSWEEIQQKNIEGLQVRLQSLDMKAEAMKVTASRLPAHGASSEGVLAHLVFGPLQLLRTMCEREFLVLSPSSLGRTRAEKEIGVKELFLNIENEWRRISLIDELLHLCCARALALPSDWRSPEQSIEFFMRLSNSPTVGCERYSPSLCALLHNIENFLMVRKSFEATMFKEEAVDLTKDEFFAEAYHSIKSSVVQLESDWRRKFEMDVLHSLFHATINPFSLYTFSFLEFEKTRLFEFRLLEIRNKYFPEFCIRTNEYSIKFYKEIGLAKQKFLQNIRDLHLKIPSDVEETTLVKRALCWRSIAVRNRFAALPEGGAADEYEKCAKPLREQWLREHIFHPKLLISNSYGLTYMLPYEMYSELGRGSESKVYSIKVFKPALTAERITSTFKWKALKVPGSLSFVSALPNEGKVAALFHQNLVPHVLSFHCVHRLFPNGQPFLDPVKIGERTNGSKVEPIYESRDVPCGLMDQCERTTLDGYIRTNPPFLPSGLRIMCDVAMALAGVHSLNRCHCDLKTDNVLLQIDTQGRMRGVLVDFSNESPMFVESGYRGSYLAPEQYDEFAKNGCMIVRPESEMFLFANVLESVRSHRDVLLEGKFAWSAMLAQKELEKNRRILPSQEKVIEAQERYKRFSLEMRERALRPGADAIDKLNGNLFSLDPRERFTAKQVVEVLEAEIAKIS